MERFTVIYHLSDGHSFTEEIEADTLEKALVEIDEKLDMPRFRLPDQTNGVHIINSREVLYTHVLPHNEDTADF